MLLLPLLPATYLLPPTTTNLLPLLPTTYCHYYLLPLLRLLLRPLLGSVTILQPTAVKEHSTLLQLHCPDEEEEDE